MEEVPYHTGQGLEANISNSVSLKQKDTKELHFSHGQSYPIHDPTIFIPGLTWVGTSRQGNRRCLRQHNQKTLSLATVTSCTNQSVPWMRTNSYTFSGGSVWVGNRSANIQRKVSRQTQRLRRNGPLTAEAEMKLNVVGCELAKAAFYQPQCLAFMHPLFLLKLVHFSGDWMIP